MYLERRRPVWYALHSVPLRLRKSLGKNRFVASSELRIGRRQSDLPLSSTPSGCPRRMGFGEAHVFRSTRKTVATLLENAGGKENVAADIIGHDKPTMTYGLYSGGNSLAMKQAAIEKLNYGLSR